MGEDDEDSEDDIHLSPPVRKSNPIKHQRSKSRNSTRQDKVQKKTKDCKIVSSLNFIDSDRDSEDDFTSSSIQRFAKGSSGPPPPPPPPKKRMKRSTSQQRPKNNASKHHDSSSSSKSSSNKNNNITLDNSSIQLNQNNDKVDMASLEISMEIDNDNSDDDIITYKNKKRIRISSSSSNDDENDDDDDGKWIDEQMISDPIDVDEDSRVDNNDDDKVSLISSDVNMSLERYSNSSHSTTKHLRRGVTHIDLVHKEHENTHIDLDELPTESLVDRCVVPLGHSTPLKKNTQSKTVSKGTSNCSSSEQFKLPELPKKKKIPQCSSCNEWGHATIKHKHCPNNNVNKDMKVLSPSSLSSSSSIPKGYCVDCGRNGHATKKNQFCQKNIKNIEAATAAAAAKIEAENQICQDCEERGHKWKYDKVCKLHVVKGSTKKAFTSKFNHNFDSSSSISFSDDSRDSNSLSSSSSRTGQCCENYGKDHKSVKSPLCDNYRPAIKTKMIVKYFGQENVNKCELFTVKMGFKSICPDEEVRRKVQADVDEISKFKVDFSIWFEFLLRYPNSPVLETMKMKKHPDFYLLYGQYLRKKQRFTPDPKVLKIFNKYKELNSNEAHAYDCTNRKNIVAQAILQWTTNFQNIIQKNCEDNLKKYFKSLVNKDGSRLHDDEAISGLIEDLLFKNKKPENDQLFKNFKDLDFKDLNRTKGSWWHFIGFFLEMQKYVKFKLSPICRHGLHHMHYDTSAVHQLLRQFENDVVSPDYSVATIGGENPKTSYVFMQMWNLFVTIPPKHKHFGYSLSTDGISASIHCLRKLDRIPSQTVDELIVKPREKIVEESEKDVDEVVIIGDDDPDFRTLSDNVIDDILRAMINKLDEEYDRYVGLDPGLKLIFSGVILEAFKNFPHPEFQERFKFKSSTYHHLTHYCTRDKKRRQWTKNYEDTYKQQLKEFTEKNPEFKVDDPSDHLNVTTYRLNLFHVGQPEYSKRKVARLRFDKFINTQIVNSMVANYIISGQLMKSVRQAKFDAEKEAKLIRQKEKERRVEDNNDENMNKKKCKKVRARTRQKRKDERKLKWKKFSEEMKLKGKINTSTVAAVAAATTTTTTAVDTAVDTADTVAAHSIKKIITRKRRKRRKKRTNKTIKIDKNGNGKKTLIAIGETDISKWMKGYRRVSLKGIRKILSDRARQPDSKITLIITNEYNTTRRCSCCLSKCIKSKSPHRYLTCPSEGCGTTWNRDPNGGRNILHLALIRSGFLPAQLLLDTLLKFRKTKPALGLLKDICRVSCRTVLPSERSA